MRKPLVILVSGAPGAGKTTLAYELADYLRIPHIPRDEIMRGIEMTEGTLINRAEQGISSYYKVLGSLLEDRISFVSDGTLYKDVSEKDIKTYLLPKAFVINIHVRADNETQRFIEREQKRDGWSNEWVDSHITHLENIYLQTVAPLDLGIPLIDVAATNDYIPNLKEIVTVIRNYYPDTRPHIKLTNEKESKNEATN